MDNPMVSIIIPAYNAENTIEAVIRSVQSQTVSAWEICVIDDCSQDDTAKMVEEMAEKDGRIHLICSEQNGGPAVARNKGIQVAMGQYIALLDADDEWTPDYLKTHIQNIEDNDADISYSGYQYVDLQKRKVGKPYIVPQTATYKDLLKENYCTPSAMVLRKEALQGHRFNPDYAHEDYVLCLAMLRDGKTARGIPAPLVSIQKGGRNANKLKAAVNRWRVYRKSEQLPLHKAFYYMMQYALAACRKYG